MRLVYLTAFLFFVLRTFPVLCSETIDAANKEESPLSDWYEKALENIREMEYEATWQESCAIPEGAPGYHFVNREQDLRLYFYPEGVKAIRRTESQPSWVLSWRIEGINAGEADILEKPAIGARKNVLEYKRGNISEVYENQDSGVKAQISVTNAPNGTDAIIARILFEGDLTIGFETNASQIDFYQEEKVVACFTNIRAQDAEGNNVPINSTLNDNELRISLKDDEAPYPVQVDFLLVTPPPWSAESNKESALFGYSVSGAGDVNGDGYSDIIIGAPGYDNGQTQEGRAYVYHGGPNGPSPISNWFFESDQIDAQLGYSVSTAGDVNGDGYSDVIIGAPKYTNDTAAEGGALIFYGSPTGLGNTFSLLEGNQTGSRFGCSVSTAGDVNKDGYSDVVVGAEDKYDKGAAYVYAGSASGIIIVPFWSYISPLDSAGFGCSVKTAGDVNGDLYSDIIIGSMEASNGQTLEGRAYAFHGGDTDMTLAWTYESDMQGFLFGFSVSTAGDVNGDGYSDVVIGAINFESGEEYEGAVYVFHGSSTGLGNEPDKVLQMNIPKAGFGCSVSTAGDMDGDGYADIIVGSKYYSSDDYEWEGAAYVFRGSKNGLQNSYSWFQKGNQYGARYGHSVSLAGDVNGDGYSDIIIGAPYYSNGENAEGKCFLYYGKPRPPSNTPNWNTENNVANCEFALSVAGAGDVNGDRYDDVMVGAYLFDNGQTNEGCVFIYHGRENDVPLTTPNRILESNLTNAYFGSSLAGAGDLNADGYDDIIIGAVGYNNFEGRVYMYLGSETGIGTSANWVKNPGLPGGQFGKSVSGAGDVNGDGHADIIIGMSSYPNGTANGRAYVYHGTPTGLTGTRRWDYVCDQEGAFFGISVASAGDVNGDGYSDVIIGASGYTNGQINEGRAYVFYGSHNGVKSSSPWIVESNQAYSVFGQSVSGAGDVNGDGYSDVIIGASYYNNGNLNEGAAFIYAGSANGLSNVPMVMLDGANQDNAMFGHSVAGAGDVNGDGFADVVVGAYKRDNLYFPILGSLSSPLTREDAGSAYIYLGSPTGISNSPDWAEHFMGANGHFGRCVAAAGDVNGDGFADVIIGAPGYRSSDVKYGRAYLYLGGGGNGRDLRVTQSSGGPSFTRISRLGKSNSNSFNIGRRTHNPFGKGKVTVEIETKEFRTPLDGSDTYIYEHYAFMSSTSTTFSKYPENALMHWRARLLYDPVTIPYQSRGPWFSIPWNGMQEADFRTGPNPNPTLQDIINYILGRSHYPHDINADLKTDAADVVHFIINQ